MPRTILDFNWSIPKYLDKMIQANAEEIKRTVGLLKKQIYTNSELAKFKAVLEKSVSSIEKAQLQKNINFWLFAGSLFGDLLTSFDKLQKSLQESFEVGRQVWIATMIIDLGYLNDPNLVQTSVSMLEAIYPDVNPVAAVVAAQRMTEQAMVTIRLQHQSMIDVQNQYASAMGFTSLDNMTKVTFAEVEKQLEAAKQNRKLGE